MKKKPSDYFKSDIFVGEKALSKINGSYCGYVEIDGIRYWDARDFEPYEITMSKNTLESDWSFRPDLKELIKGSLESSQK